LVVTSLVFVIMPVLGEPERRWVVGRGLRRRWRAFVFDWLHRRYTFRFSALYKCAAVVLVIVSSISFAFNLSVRNVDATSYTSAGTFIDYECSAANIWFIATTTVVVGIFGFVEAITAYLTASHQKIKDIMAAGTWSLVLGATAKWVPWVVSLFHIALSILSIIVIVFILAVGTCAQQFNQNGVYAVENCRMFYTPGPSACSTSTQFIWSCNSADFLFSNGFTIMDCMLTPEESVL